MYKNHIEISLSKIRAIYEKAAEKIEAIPPGEKIPATGLANDLGAEIGMPGASVYPIIKVLLDGYPGVVVKRGAMGGIIKLQAIMPSPKLDYVDE